MYALSKDYEKLYDLICGGARVAAYVDNRYGSEGDEVEFRDLCNVERRGEWQISFYVRGCGYGHVTRINSIDGKRTEKEAFILACKSLSVEFIPPNTSEYAAIFSSEHSELDFNKILESKGELVIDLRSIEIESLGLSSELLCKLILGAYRAMPDDAKTLVRFIGQASQAEKLLNYAGEYALELNRNPSMKSLLAQ